MEIYRDAEKRIYWAILFKENKTGKIGLVYNSDYNEKEIRDYWEDNELNYKIIELKPIKNVKTLQFFIYWNKLPRAYNTQEQREYKFDFFKYVCGADLSEKYRGLEKE